MFISDAEQIEYTRLLDSLARFYNSEITAHVGYELTFTVGIVAAILAITSMVVELWREALLAMLIIDFVCIVVFILLGRWPCLKYLFGRVHYYDELSQSTFEHMGLKTLYIPHSKSHRWRAHEYQLGLRERALTREDGIEGAIIALFLARLYVSKCNRPKKIGDRTDPSTIKQKLERVFGVGDIVRPDDNRYVRPVMLGEWFARTFGWMFVDVLLLACRQEKDWIGKERAALLFPDC